MLLYRVPGLIAVAAILGGWSHGFVAAPAPTLTKLSLNNAGINGGVPVTFTGTNLTGASCPKINGVSTTNCVNVSSTTITAKTPVSAAGGPYDVTVTTPGGTSTLSAYFTYAGISVFQPSGTADASGVKQGGTEGRGLARHKVKNGNKMSKTGASAWETCSNASLSWDGTQCWTEAVGFGFWGDSNCATNDQGANQGPQIYMLSSSRGSWVVDKNFTDTCNTTAFTVNNALASLDLAFFGNGTANTRGEILAASDAGIAAPDKIWLRDDTTGGWTSYDPSGSGAIRALGHFKSTFNTTNHCADNNCRDLILTGQNPSGLGAATLNSGAFGISTYVNAHSGSGLIPFSVDGTEGNLCAAQTLDGCLGLDSQWDSNLADPNGCAVGGKIVQGCLKEQRVLSIITCPVTSGGNDDGVALFVTMGWTLLRMVDKGTNSYLVRWNQASNTVVEANTQQNGFRGATCIPNGHGGWVIRAFAQIQGDVIDFDPNTQMTLSPPSGYGGTKQTSVIGCLQTLWSSSSGSFITGYNGGEIFQIDNTLLAGMGNSRGTPSSRPHFSAASAVDFVPGVWKMPLEPSGGGACNGFTIWPSNPGTTANPPPILAAMQTPNVCANGSNCTWTGNGQKNPTVSIGANCTTDANGYCKAMGSNRTMICSPFPEDGANSTNGQCGRVLSLAFRDMGSPALSHNSAGVVRVPIDNDLGIQ